VALGAVFVAALITMGRFRSSAPKAQNGFVAPPIVSSQAFRRNNLHSDMNDFSDLYELPLTETAF
jgi:hypothetical protein